MDKFKQTFIDILVVCIAPVFIVILSHFLLNAEQASDQLLSADSMTTVLSTPGESAELGAKSREILILLGSIRFDVEFFNDKAFQSLTDFTPLYISTSTGREYPFSLPYEVSSTLTNFQDPTTITAKTPASTATSKKSSR